MNNSKITKIVLTGGPCGGKSTAISQLRTIFENIGHNVITIPESATHILSGMGVITGSDFLSIPDFQDMVIKLQIDQEGIADKIASLYKKQTLIILDRGLLDIKAYITVGKVNEILEKHGLIEQSILMDRYDAVIHMTSTAVDAQEFYTVLNNPARVGTCQEQAKQLDILTEHAYIGAKNRYVVDNSTDFFGKINRVKSLIFQFLSLPNTIDI